jgi:hypothetical protein
VSSQHKLIPLRPRNDSGQFIVWRLVKPRTSESVRWETIDQRWISLSLGHGEELGSVIVSDSTGRRVVADSYEGGLELAKDWRR